MRSGFLTYEESEKVEGGRITDLKEIQSVKGVLDYSFKSLFGYISKGFGLGRPWIDLFKGKRLIRSSGDLYGKAAKNRITFECRCKNCGGPVSFAFTDEWIRDYADWSEPLVFVNRVKAPP
jgi:hypothetical protein